jgi:hypothetical protein
MGGHSGGGGGHGGGGGGHGGGHHGGGGGDHGSFASTGSGSTWKNSLAASRADDAAADYSDLHVEQNLPEGTTQADKPLGTGRWGRWLRRSPKQ